VTAILETSLAAAVTAARRRLDEHVREIVGWHFDPATGTPFWLDHARRLDFDPRREIGGYDDLRRFGDQAPPAGVTPEAFWALLIGVAFGLSRTTTILVRRPTL